jgi:hypothetical protein
MPSPVPPRYEEPAAPHRAEPIRKITIETTKIVFRP